MEAPEEVLFSEGYDSSKAFITDWALLISLSRVEQYKAECDLFQKKYGMNLEEFEFCLHREKGHEDFEKEEDLADWQFSLQTMKWWQEKVKEIEDSMEDL